MRYESLVADPLQEMSSFLQRVGVAPAVPLEDAVAEHTLARARQGSSNMHFWMGTPGLWRRLLPPDIAFSIRQRHPEVFETLGYECEPDPLLTAEAAAENWRMITHKGERGRK